MRGKTINFQELQRAAMGFDRAMEIKPLYFGENKDIELKGWKAIYNMDKKKVATVTSERYNKVDHVEVVNAVTEAIQNLNLPGTAIVNDGGNRVFVDITFDGIQHKVKLQKGEEFFVGLRIINSYDKTTGIIVAPRMLRCVCNNGMVVSRIMKGYAVKHSKKMTQDFEATIAAMLKRMINSIDSFKNRVNECIADSIEWEIMVEILKDLAKSEKHIEKIKALLPQNPTRWSLYNAFTEYCTHDDQLRPNVEHRLQGQAQKVLVTPLKRLVPKKALA